MSGAKNVGSLKYVLLVFLGIYTANLIIPLVGPYSYTQRLWLVANVIMSILSVIILIKEKLPTPGQMVLGAIMAILVSISSPVTGITTALAYVASVRVFEQIGHEVLIVKRPVGLSLFLGIGIGIGLGVINLFLAGGQELVFAPSYEAFFVALNPGISEEVIYRLFVYALTLYLLGRRPTRKETIWVYMLMIVPHVLMHFPDTYFVNGILHLDLGTLLIGPLVLTLLFGLPMTLLMVRRDLMTAMITHFMVDFIRFVFLGLPF